MFKFKIKSRRRKIKPTTNPGLVWRWFVGVFLILTAAVLGGGYWLYRQLAEIEEFSQRRLAERSMVPLQLNLEALDKVLTRLEAKARRAEEIKSAPLTLSDPAAGL